MNTPTTKTRNIISFFELSPEWQAEAIRNLDDLAEETSYFEPEEDDDPSLHILWDLSECMRVDDPEMDGVIGISNSSALAVKLSPCGEVATTWIIG